LRRRVAVFRSVSTVFSSSEKVSFAIRQYYHTAIPRADLKVGPYDWSMCRRLKVGPYDGLTCRLADLKVGPCDGLIGPYDWLMCDGLVCRRVVPAARRVKLHLE